MKKKSNCGGYCAILVVVAFISFIALIASTFGGHSSAAPSLDDLNATTTAQAQQTSDSSAFYQDTPADSPTPTPTIKAQPTRQVAQPTPKSTQAPTCQAVNSSPWCYNFSSGNLIYNPPADFCNYFNCISSFWNGSGFVNECSDGTYSLSGGHSGDCSHHGGEWRPLYSH